MEKVSTLKFLTICTVFLICGTWNSIASKLFYETTAPIDGHEKAFKKPWFQVWGMFVGMTQCAVIVAYEKGEERRKRRRSMDCGMGGASSPWRLQVPHDEAGSPVSGGAYRQTVGRTAFLVAAPALCDLIAVFFQSISLLWTDVSIWQMLRGAIILNTVLIRKFFLKKSSTKYELVGVFVVFLALVIVGFASVFSENDGAGTAVSPFLKLMGILCMVIGQFVQALQNVVEEKLLDDSPASPAFIASMEGVWGLIFCTLIFMPIAQYSPGTDGDGVREDSFESITMLAESGRLQIIFALYTTVIMGYNWLGLTITNITEATTRNVIDALRTLCVWVVALVLGQILPEYGEQWGWWCWIELVGFIVLTIGFFIYQGMIQLPGYRYEVESDFVLWSPGATTALLPVAKRTDDDSAFILTENEKAF